MESLSEYSHGSSSFCDCLRSITMTSSARSRSAPQTVQGLSVIHAAPSPRPVARAQRMRFAVASTPKQGTYGGSTSPEGEDKQAKNEAAGCVDAAVWCLQCCDEYGNDCLYVT